MKRIGCEISNDDWKTNGGKEGKIAEIKIKNRK